ncbi:MAG: VWA domain-containing protein [Acidobacteriota bacterium]
MLQRPAVGLILGGLVFGVLALGTGFAATKKDDPPRIEGEEVEVRVVNVEAVITDAAGKRVRNLGRGDFELIVDGKKVGVDYFSEIAEGAEVKPSSSSAVTTAATATTAKVPVAAPEPERVARNYLIYIDEVFALANVRDVVLAHLATDLSTLGPADRVSVLAFDGKKIDVLCPWTGDPKQVAAALDRARQRPAVGNRLIADQRRLEGDTDFIRENGEALADGDSTQGANSARNLIDTMSKRISPEARTEIGKVTEALAGALRGLEAPPGRKVMLLLSGAWSMQVAGHLFGPLLAAADQNGYTIYPVDLANSSASEISAFDQLGRATGGHAVVAANLRILPAVEQDTSSYYLLGFSPAWKANEIRHHVEVKVTRPGLTVRTRGSFLDRTSSRDAAARAEGVLLLGGDPTRQRLYVLLGAPKRLNRKEVEIPVTLGVPVELLLEGRAPGPQRIELPLAVAILDTEGRRSELAGSRLQANLPATLPAGTLARFQTVIKVRNVGQKMAFTLGGLSDGTTIWGRAEFQAVPKG